ncbi:pentapeptide repeat-containing protein [Nostoc sp. LEGE 12447]|uniref:pentapeptide repeat-containing protein n=1 Tax=Nostoc sp. LEGE 12447 TaxID=1828640 RepID=UPI001D14E712|nr:pentapeptide repeat-containing protein [Nostoc sp. LEGE 12447]
MSKPVNVSKKQIPKGWENLRVGLERISNENDPLLREIILQEEATRFKKPVNDYRQLFESYKKNKAEFLPAYPQHRWSVMEWWLWFFNEVTPIKRNELLKNSFLTLIEKGVLITGAFAFVKWVMEAPQRKRQEQYQAWQIIHLAKGEEVSGARKQALEDLNRQKVSFAGLSCERAVLQEINLEKANLYRANLKNANLKGANLSDAILWNSHLSNADLTRANLKGANLMGANLNDANLNDANLSGANLNGAILWNALLWNTNFNGAILWNARLTNAQLFVADLSGADLSDADLSDADLSGADLSHANLSHANLSRANLSHANLSRANLSHANLSHANLSCASFLEVEQVKAAKSWKEALYNEDFRQLLGLPPEPELELEPELEPETASINYHQMVQQEIERVRKLP